jgi:hypothetical protein
MYLPWLTLCVAQCLCPVALAETIHCAATTKYRCLPHEGCQPIPNTISVVIDVPKGNVSRCDGKGCDIFPVQVAASGDYLNFIAASRGYLVKTSNDGRYFSEVATLANSVLLSFGVCSSR